MDIICMLIFTYSRWWKRKYTLKAKDLSDMIAENNEDVSSNAVSYRRSLLMGQEVNDRWEDRALAVSFLAIIIDLIVATVMDKRTMVTAWIRPFVVASFTASIRENFITLLKDLRGAGIVLSMIFIFIFVYSTVCHYFYEGKYGGFQYFATMPMAYYRMLILLTTANFPDIMLPAYDKNFWNCLIFISFLIIGLYFLSNVLLANVFSKFNKRLK